MVRYLSHQSPDGTEDPEVMGRFLSKIMSLTEGSWFKVSDVVDEINSDDLPHRLRVSLATDAPGYTKSFGRALCYGGEISGDLEVETYARGKKGRVYRIIRKEDRS
jgi:hypothetical protein